MIGIDFRGSLQLIERYKLISNVRYKIEQYFGVTALHQGAGQARFTTLAKEVLDRLCYAIAFNIKDHILWGSGIRFQFLQLRNKCVWSMRIATGQRAKGEDQAQEAAHIHGF